MEIRDAAEKREALEKDIQEYLTIKLNEFLDKTSLMPSSIFISIEGIYVMGSPIPVRVTIDRVEIEIRL